MDIQVYLKDEFAVNGDMYRQTIKHLASLSVRTEITGSQQADTNVLFKRNDWVKSPGGTQRKREVFSWLAELYWAVHISDCHQTCPEFFQLSAPEQDYVKMISGKLSVLCRAQWLRYKDEFDRSQVYLGGALRRLLVVRHKRTPALCSPDFQALVRRRCNAEKDDIINLVNKRIGLSFSEDCNESASDS